MDSSGEAQAIMGSGSVVGWAEEPRLDCPRARPVSRSAALGAYGERLAARHLTELGMVVLDRNWTAPSDECVAGEIDLVLRDGNTLVICEVKTRSSVVAGTPHQAIDAARAERLQMLGQAWLRAHPGMHPGEMRVDLVAVLRPRRGPSTIEHVQGIC